MRQSGLQVHLIDHVPIEEVLDQFVLDEIGSDFQFSEHCIWDLPTSVGPADWIYCCDVMEHIPENVVEPTLWEMSKRTIKGGLIQVALGPDGFGARIGEELHVTIQSESWWTAKMKKYWDNISVERVNDYRVVYYVGKGKDYEPY